MTTASKNPDPSGGSEPLEHLSAAQPGRRWTFLSNHAHALICLRVDPRARIRDLAARIGITERGVQKVLTDLEHEGLVVRRKEGRRNVYELHLEQPLRHPIESHRVVRELVDLILRDVEPGTDLPSVNGRNAE